MAAVRRGVPQLQPVCLATKARDADLAHGLGHANGYYYYTGICPAARRVLRLVPLAPPLVLKLISRARSLIGLLSLFV